MARTTRLVLMIVFAVAVTSVIASTSASAAECKQETSKKFAFCVGSSKILTEGKEFDIDIRQPSGAFYTLTAAGITIRCPEVVETLALLSAQSGVVELSPFQLHFLFCKVIAGEHCDLESEQILTEKLEGKIVAKKELEFYPEPGGTTFAGIKINSSGGTCLVAGTDKVVAKEGKTKEGPLCGVPTAETPATSHLVECGGKASNLKFAGKEASFEGTFDDVYLAAEKEESYSFIEGS